MERKRLPTTSYAVLGLLTLGEKSGYDVLKLAHRSVGHFWTPAKSQVYSELKRLAELGYARERRVEQDVRPDKTMYAITREGEQALRAWLEESDVAPDHLRSPFTLQVFFGALIPKETLIAKVKERRRQAQDVLDELRETERRIKGDPARFYPYLTLKAGLALTEAEIRWADEVIEGIEREDPERKEDE